MPLDEERFARKDYVDLIFASARQAIDIANKDLDRRLEAMNEFRAQLTKQAESFLTIAAYEIKHDALMRRVDALEQEAAAHRSRQQGISNIWKVVVAVVGFLATAATIISFINALRIH